MCSRSIKVKIGLRINNLSYTMKNTQCSNMHREANPVQ